MGTEKYLISNSFYTYLISQTNAIADYRSCKAFVRNAIEKSLKGEVQKVSSFAVKKVDFEI